MLIYDLYLKLNKYVIIHFLKDTQKEVFYHFKISNLYIMFFNSNET